MDRGQNVGKVALALYAGSAMGAAWAWPRLGHFCGLRLLGSAPQGWQLWCAVGQREEKLWFEQLIISCLPGIISEPPAKPSERKAPIICQ